MGTIEISGMNVGRGQIDCAERIKSTWQSTSEDRTKSAFCASFLFPDVLWRVGSAVAQLSGLLGHTGLIDGPMAGTEDYGIAYRAMAA